MRRRNVPVTQDGVDRLLARALCIKAVAREKSCSLEVASHTLTEMAKAEARTDVAATALRCARDWSGNPDMDYAEAAEYIGRITEAYTGQ